MLQCSSTVTAACMYFILSLVVLQCCSICQQGQSCRHGIG